jgi:hypothetical protein
MMGAYQSSPSVAFDGTNFLVVYQDNWWGPYDISGTRVDQAGNVLDPNGFTVSNAGGNQWNPAIAFDGANYLVAWQDERNSSSIDDIYGTRVTPEGIILDTAGIAITTVSDLQRLPCVGWDGVNYIVAWQDERDDLDIYCTRVDTAGVVLDPTGILLSSIDPDQREPAIVFDGNNSFVVWHEGDIRGIRLDQSGNVVDTNTILVSTTICYFPQIAADVVFDGLNYFVVWEDNHYGIYNVYDIYGARVSQNGGVIDVPSIPISLAPNSQGTPAVAYDGSNYMVTWCDGRSGGNKDIYCCRIDTFGVVLDTAGIPVSTGQQGEVFPEIAFDGTNYVIVWQDGRSVTSGTDIYGARVTQSGVVLDQSGFAITTALKGQEYSAVVFDGTYYFAVWMDYRDSTITRHDIYGARFTSGGVVLDTLGIPICKADNPQRYPQVAFDGTNYMVVWQDSRTSPNTADIYGARVTQSGSVLDTAGIPLWVDAEVQANPVITFDGVRYYVVFQHIPSVYNDLYGIVVNTSGVVSDTFVVSAMPGNQLAPALACGQDSQLIAVFQGHVDSMYGNYADTLRVWAQYHPVVGINELAGSEKHVESMTIHLLSNPVSRTCCLEYSLPQQTMVDISLFDIAGRFTGIHQRSIACAGNHRRVIDLVDLAQGVYFVRFSAGDWTETKKIVLLE